MNNIVAIIPARGGSKGVLRKNLVELNGKPLIAYVIQAALAVKKNIRVIVSTDDEEIASVARKWGAEVPFIRAASLAEDQTPDYPVLKDAVDRLKTADYSVDIVAHLRPTYPLIDSKELSQALELLIKSNADAVRSVVPVDYHPNWMKRIENGKLTAFSQDQMILRRQDLDPVYKTAGIDVFWSRNLDSDMNILGQDILPLLSETSHVVDIDTLEDFKLAEFYLQQQGQDL